MVLEKVNAAVLAERERIATRARSELAAAGLPVVVPGLDKIVSSGVEVSVCEYDDCSGVKVTWWCSPRLWLSAKRALDCEPRDMPLIEHQRTVVEAMTPAIRTILVSAGFKVFDRRATVRRDPSTCCPPRRPRSCPCGGFATTSWTAEARPSRGPKA